MALALAVDTLACALISNLHTHNLAAIRNMGLLAALEAAGIFPADTSAALVSGAAGNTVSQAILLLAFCRLVFVGD